MCEYAYIAFCLDDCEDEDCEEMDGYTRRRGLTSKQKRRRKLHRQAVRLSRARVRARTFILDALKDALKINL